MGGCYCSGEGTQSRVDIVIGSIGIVVGGIGIFVGGIGIVGVLLDEEMMVLLVVLPKDYWKLDVLLGEVLLFYCCGWVLWYFINDGRSNTTINLLGEGPSQSSSNPL